MSASWSLPDNLARIRKARDLSQEQLAAAAMVAVDTIARIERGERKTTRPATVRKLATALGVPEDTLVGIARSARDSDSADVAGLRHAITATDEIPGLCDFAENDEVVLLSTLTSTAHKAWRAYVDGHHAKLLHDLPPLLVDARRLTSATDGDSKAAAHRVLSTTYRLGAGLAGRLGLDDLAWTSAERALHAARASDSAELEIAISLRYLVWTMVRQGRTEEAERVAIRAAEQIEPRMLERNPNRSGVFGNLLFNAAAAAGRAGATARASDFLAVAESAAARSGSDHASETAIFGPRVARFQAIEHAVRSGDPETALRLAEHVPDARGDIPAFWEAGHRLTLAWAAVQVRNDKRAISYLAEARQFAPDWVRHQPLGATTMRALVDRAARRRGAHFAALATHYGVVDDRRATT